MANVPTFETERLILRELTLEDAPDYQKHFAHWHIIRNLTNKIPWPYPEDGAETFIREMVLPGQGEDKWCWAICLKEEPDALIGCIDLRKNGGPEHRGFWLSKEHWGKGYMTEAVPPVMDYAFNELGFDKLVFSNALGNDKSRRVKEKTGARLISVENHAKIHDPEYTHCEYWELTKADWQSFRQGQQCIKQKSLRL